MRRRWRRRGRWGGGGGSAYGGGSHEEMETVKHLLTWLELGSCDAGQYRQGGRATQRGDPNFWDANQCLPWSKHAVPDFLHWEHIRRRSGFVWPWCHVTGLMKQMKGGLKSLLQMAQLTIQLWGERVRCEPRLRGQPAGVLCPAPMLPSCLGLSGSRHLPRFIPLLCKMGTWEFQLPGHVLWVGRNDLFWPIPGTTVWFLVMWYYASVLFHKEGRHSLWGQCA